MSDNTTRATVLTRAAELGWDTSDAHRFGYLSHPVTDATVSIGFHRTHGGITSAHFHPGREGAARYRGHISSGGAADRLAQVLDYLAEYAKPRTLADLATGDIVGDRLVLTTTPDSHGVVTVRTTGSRWLSGPATDLVGPAGDPSLSDVAELRLHRANVAAREAWVAWNATLPVLPETVAFDGDRYSAACPHVITGEDVERIPSLKDRLGQPCGADLSLGMDAYETADVYGWGPSPWDGETTVLLTGYGEDAASGDHTRLGCYNNHHWQVPSDTDAIDD